MIEREKGTGISVNERLPLGEMSEVKPGEGNKGVTRSERSQENNRGLSPKEAQERQTEGERRGGVFKAERDPSHVYSIPSTTAMAGSSGKNSAEFAEPGEKANTD